MHILGMKEFCLRDVLLNKTDTRPDGSLGGFKSFKVVSRYARLSNTLRDCFTLRDEVSGTDVGHRPLIRMKRV